MQCLDQSSTGLASGSEHRTRVTQTTRARNSDRVTAVVPCHVGSRRATAVTRPSRVGSGVRAGSGSEPEPGLVSDPARTRSRTRSRRPHDRKMSRLYSTASKRGMGEGGRESILWPAAAARRPGPPAAARARSGRRGPRAAEREHPEAVPRLYIGVGYVPSSRALGEAPRTRPRRARTRARRTYRNRPRTGAAARPVWAGYSESPARCPKDYTCVNGPDSRTDAAAAGPREREREADRCGSCRPAARLGAHVQKHLSRLIKEPMRLQRAIDA
jgi:hypothetical protein